MFTNCHLRNNVSVMHGLDTFVLYNINRSIENTVYFRIGSGDRALSNPFHFLINNPFKNILFYETSKPLFSNVPCLPFVFDQFFISLIYHKTKFSIYFMNFLGQIFILKSLL